MHPVAYRPYMYKKKMQDYDTDLCSYLVSRLCLMHLIEGRWHKWLGLQVTFTVRHQELRIPSCCHCWALKHGFLPSLLCDAAS